MTYTDYPKAELAIPPHVLRRRRPSQFTPVPERLDRRTPIEQFDAAVLRLLARAKLARR